MSGNQNQKEVLHFNMSIEYYQQNASSFFEGTVNVDMTNIYQHFTQHLSDDALILDAGCGSGRDTKAFIDMGYQVDAFDASSKLAELASAYTNTNIKVSTFDQVTDDNKYDGIWCCASLLHVPKQDLLQTMRQLAKALKPNGVMYVSFKYGIDQREKDGRLFTDIDENGLKQLLCKVDNIFLIHQWITEDNRPSRNEKWLNATLLKK